jgi:hypothetical protein
MADFSSLLQLGIGLGIGLSLFRAPLERRAETLGRTIDGQLTIIQGVNTPLAQERNRQLADLKVTYLQCRTRLEEAQKPLMCSVVVGAAINLICLVYAALYADKNVHFIVQYLLIFASSLYYLVIWLIIEAIAGVIFRDVRKRLKALTVRAR